MFPTVAEVAVPKSPKESHYFALPSKRWSLRARSCYYLLPSKRAAAFATVVVVPNGCPIPEGGRFAALVVFPNFPKKDPLFCLQKGGRFAPVVVVICCLRKGGRFAPVVVVICCLIKGGRFAGVVVVPNYCKIQEGGRFAALVGICEKKDSLFCSKGRPLREKSGRFAALVGICGSRFSKKDSLFCLQKGGRFAKKAAAIVAVPIPIVFNYCSSRP